MVIVSSNLMKRMTLRTMQYGSVILSMGSLPGSHFTFHRDGAITSGAFNLQRRPCMCRRQRDGTIELLMGTAIPPSLRRLLRRQSKGNPYSDRRLSLILRILTEFGNLSRLRS